jgi:hypothetical protein
MTYVQAWIGKPQSDVYKGFCIEGSRIILLHPDPLPRGE